MSLEAGNAPGDGPGALWLSVEEAVPTVTAAISIPWATEEETDQAAWILIRPGFLVALFLVGWAVDVMVFSAFRVDYMTALGLAKDELVSPQRLISLAAVIGIALGFFRSLAHAQVPLPLVLWSILLTYVAAILAILGWLPGPLARASRWRVPLGRALRRCICPDMSKEVPFVEVLVADGLTSLAKVFFDLAVGSCIAASTLDVSSGSLVESLLPETFHAVVLRGNATAVLQETRATRLSGLAEQCKRSSMPFFAWATPFLIRARQCIVTARHAPDSLSRDLQRVNLLKYLSALPVIGFALCYERVGASIPWLVFDQEDFEALWAMAAVVNSVFSFFWDLTMDWGLLQPGTSGAHFGLRPVLLFRGMWGFYHLAIVLNLLGRTLWSLRWSTEATVFLGSFFLSTFQQAAEVLRRCSWNVLRVEWECIKKNLHRSDKHFPV
mmetsp:Transcript_24359/g.61811  ORF Transcript_24359/g.61811 Transcript_24359/m.61811 type:complete len:440 (-) Transcript_24359:111-1430(-)|eukprot:CAMPEP_0195122768 /NCGR_PEP_ID=MMETSP0448-20130528/127212_1 /TAXON_ID=66468 /ORGANISM="Heterocapsa triquestra, Strain CCMP 448" /LENGTH=439 /DNA_ID=CAMNT_0040160277 /DNA_START=64 /DNA_END=1383 /DNA_ORIENTATION=+